MSPPNLLPLLKQYFGYSSFRPLQEAIIRDALAGKDVLALLPTGGGKSLCFQLPALARPGLTVVVSPLIALMKDQVDALRAAGVPATFLNSSLGAGESRPRLRGLHQGEFRLLYVAPERLMLSGFLEDLQRWNVQLIAVDEAHCISEWGHDFRPEYRQIAGLRPLFPGVPMMALTATATERVREDILRQLQLRDPAVYVASFNRPNLTYRVSAKTGAYRQILDFLRPRRKEAGIIYCQSRKATEALASKLSADGFGAVPYHAGLSADERTQNQELFLRDESRVVCATIAFGMGINKPNVRFVIHYDLPKNVEGYYQETGRAGRDGLPSECLLLFSAGDVQKYMGFIQEKPDAREQQVARAQLQQIVHYAENSGCRRAELLEYFGEEFPEENCGACDNCLSPRATWDGTVEAQKFLSCVFRVRQKSGFSMGLAHIAEVLRGADTQAIRQRGHETLSTYGIGADRDKAAWTAIGRELVRLGYLRQDTGKFSTVDITPEGLAVLKSRSKITLTKPVAAPVQQRRMVGDIACDEALFETLRQLRKRLADELGVPPYIVFGDNSLRLMARLYPQSEAEFRRISGVGDQKVREFGTVFLAAIAEHLATNARQMFADESFEPPPLERSRLTDTVLETLHFFRQGREPGQIAEIRRLGVSTIYEHLAIAVEVGEAVDTRRLVSAAARTEISAALEPCGFASLSLVRDALGGRHDYGPIKLVRAEMLAARRGGGVG
jgi:ATP-dependent DNA helicase RecQ